MASNSSDEEVQVKDEVRDNGESQEKVKHRFSEPWEESDVILVVEDEQFHVHRLILSMNSPVFKAMFKSQFKEATANNIPMPEKKAGEVLDLLKRIYFQHNQEPVEITIENVEYLLKLSDEYQVKHIFDACIEFVENESIKKENVIKLRRMADLYNLGSVEKGCNDFLKNMRLKNLYAIVNPETLDQETLQHFLEQRIERLETFFEKVYPEFMGMVECLFWLMDKCDLKVRWCAQHVTDGSLDHPHQIDSKEIRECSDCQAMLYSVWRVTSSGKLRGQQYWNYHYGSHCWQGYHFENLKSTINDFWKLKHG